MYWVTYQVSDNIFMTREILWNLKKKKFYKSKSLT